MKNNLDEIHATKVIEENRLDMLPKYFGKEMMPVEASVYAFMERLCDDYHGGYWHFYELSNGGFYMAPDIDGELALSWPDNYFDGEMSADAAGIVACLFAYSYVASVHRSEQVAKMYEGLRDYALDHPEASLILRAID